MFHSSTSDANKQIILESLSKPDSTVHVVFATTALGMGVNFVGLRATIHYGAPRSLDDYFQESGRAESCWDNKAYSFSFRHSTQFRKAGLWIRIVDSQFFACCYYHISTENCCESINTGVEVFLALGSIPNTLNRCHSVPWSLVLFKYKFFQITCIVYDNTMCHVIHVLCLKPTSTSNTHITAATTTMISIIHVLSYH